MADLGDFDAFQSGANTFSVLGKQYRAPLPSGALVLWIKRVSIRQGKTGEKFEAASDALAALGLDNPIEGLTIEEAMLGKDLLAQLIADGVVGEVIERVSRGILIGTLSGSEDLARRVAQGEDPNGWGPANRQERRAAKAAVKKAAAKKKAPASGTTSTAGAATTPGPASGSTTRSPRKPAKTASPGKQS